MIKKQSDSLFDERSTAVTTKENTTLYVVETTYTTPKYFLIDL